jgi:hypothetical protein
MAVRTECRGAAADAGVVPGSHLPALANPRAPFSASFSKRWLSGANHRRIPHCPSAIDCGAPNRDVHRRGAVSLPGSKSGVFTGFLRHGEQVRRHRPWARDSAIAGNMQSPSPNSDAPPTLPPVAPLPRPATPPRIVMHSHRFM